MHNPTREQEEAIQAYLTGENLRIEALAGTGKTTTLQMLVSRGSPRGGKLLYTSFGARVVREAKAKFPKTCRVATNHSLAWGVGQQYQRTGRLQTRISPGELIGRFGWGDSTFAPYVDGRSGAYGVIETITAFCQSSASQVEPIHAYGPALRGCRGDKDNAARLARLLAELANEAWEDITDPRSTMGVTHDVYLKQWAMTNPQLRYSTVMVDEMQDSNPLLVGVLKQQECQLVIVGDRRQAIYGFRGAVNAMDSFEIQHSTHLTQSFRFGPEIARVANDILLDQCGSDVMVQGDPNQPGLVGPCETPHCFLSRTNASIIGQLFLTSSLCPEYKLGVVGGVDDLVKLVDGAENLKAGLPTNHPELAEFSHWRQVEEAVQHEAYTHLRSLVGLVGEYGTRDLRIGLERIRGNETDAEGCDVLFSTAHKAKGSEFESVKLLDDFNPKGPPGAEELFKWRPEDGNLLYVAVTRARKHLDVTQCEAVLNSLAPGHDVHQMPQSECVDYMAFPASEAHQEPPARQPQETLLEGRWDHPYIQGGTIDVVADPEGILVTVTALGIELFQTYGLVRVIRRDRNSTTVMVGTGQLQVPHDSVGLTPA